MKLKNKNEISIFGLQDLFINFHNGYTKVGYSLENPIITNFQIEKHMQNEFVECFGGKGHVIGAVEYQDVILHLKCKNIRTSIGGFNFNDFMEKELSITDCLKIMNKKIDGDTK